MVTDADNHGPYKFATVCQGGIIRRIRLMGAHFKRVRFRSTYFNIA
jgi:hypothetical protein